MDNGVSRQSRKGVLADLAFSFLRLGTMSIGGPAMHISLMRQEFVLRRGWLTEQEFLDRLGVTNLIPGPSSTEMAIHIGYQRGGWAGLVLGGVCFLLPAVLITGLIAALYVKMGNLPEADRILATVKPVVIAIILKAVWGLSRTALKTPVLWAVAALATVLLATGVGPLAVLAVCGLASLCATRLKQNLTLRTVDGLSLWTIFFTFAKIGSVIFGSGYVLVAFLQDDLVWKTHWLTEKQLLDAVAVGQITPGPVFSTVTFIGYLLAGWQGALAATAGVFLPAFVFVGLSGLVMDKLRKSAVVGQILDGVNVAAFVLIGFAGWILGRAAITGIYPAVVTVASLILMTRFGVNTAWLVIGGIALGLATSFIP